MLRNIAPIVIIILAVLIGIGAVTGPEGYFRLPQLETRLAAERSANDNLRQSVNNLKVEIWDLQHQDRALEKAARNQQGLARDNELVYFFDEQQ